MVTKTVIKEVLAQLLQGLTALHQQGIIYRDVKPENVLVDPLTRTLRLIDFGSAADMRAGLLPLDPFAGW